MFRAAKGPIVQWMGAKGYRFVQTKHESKILVFVDPNPPYYQFCLGMEV